MFSNLRIARSFAFQGFVWENNCTLNCNKFGHKLCRYFFSYFWLVLNIFTDTKHDLSKNCFYTVKLYQWVNYPCFRVLFFFYVSFFFGTQSTSRQFTAYQPLQQQTNAIYNQHYYRSRIIFSLGGQTNMLQLPFPDLSSSSRPITFSTIMSSLAKEPVRRCGV